VPPGVSLNDFTSALTEFKRVVGEDWVFTSDEDLDLYRDAYSPFLNEPEERVASGAVAPASTEEVQQIVRVANRYRIPLYTISTGKNLGYGGSAPAYSGSIVLDLKRMNRILEVNEANAYALVEPGVSYFDLYRYIQERKLKVWID
jgi:4-cresol dehydrogenase (hydroxylating)